MAMADNDCLWIHNIIYNCFNNKTNADIESFSSNGSNEWNNDDRN